MDAIFRGESLKLPCPNCGHEITQPLIGLKEDMEIPCPKCHMAIKISEVAELVKAFKSVSKSISDLQGLFDALSDKR
jgi:DNA-directed RNA polymerase subunit RPC12/RpoP